MEERKLIDAINDTYYRLTSELVRICRSEPTKTVSEIPGVQKALDAVNEFEEFVKKYFNLVYNSRTYSWEEIE